jgi:pimeloyl-ACP methyl ester carboxylesterase
MEDSMEIVKNGKMQRLATASAAVALLATAFPALSDEQSGGNQVPVNVPPPPPLVWAPCAANPARDCAVLRVPLNYANLSEGFIELPVARRRASGPGQFLGPMVMNFGGPAFPSGSAMAGAGDENFTAEMRDLYDLVAIDARGTTNTIICFDSSQLAEYWETNRFARTTAELNHMLDLERAANQRCLQHDPSLVRHMSTAESIRDLESLRLALGVNQFTFYGISYGTFFGNRYATLYPGRIRAMVLDAVVDHGISDPQITADVLKTHEDGWTAFKQWCADTANECRLRGQDLNAVFDQVLAKARSPGIPAPLNSLQPNRPVNDWELNFMLEAMMAPGNRFAWMEAILYEASQNNDASLAGALYDSSVLLQADGTYRHGAIGILRGIHCVDSRWSQLLPNATAVRAFTLAFKAVSPHFGEAGWVQGSQQCFGYPVAPIEAAPVNSQVAPGIPPVLVIGGTLDKNTPFKWAQNVAARIPDSRLIVRNGPGHGNLGKSRCVQQIVANYLAHGIAPVSGTQCPTDADLYPPLPVPDLSTALAGRSGSNLLQGKPRTLLDPQP